MTTVTQLGEKKTRYYAWIEPGKAQNDIGRGEVINFGRNFNYKFKK